MRGLKLEIEASQARRYRSHPIWVRGLKHGSNIQRKSSEPSHPIWVRGLKQEVVSQAATEQEVAPYMGAWIETGDNLNNSPVDMSHPI